MTLTNYHDFKDNLQFEKYTNFMKNVIDECSRILKKDGRLIIEIADSVLTEGKFVQLAGLIKKSQSIQV
ncbi:MAG: DNA methyltransferase [Nanoarchaeota archaeon]